MGTTTLLALEKLFNEAIGDDLEFDTTTNIAANTSVISTTLTSYDGGQDSYFVNWWVYITEGNNIGVLRQVSAYTSSTGTLTVRGANLSAETGAVTCRLHRYDRALKKQALQRAIEFVYPSIFVPVDDYTLITGNMLPDASFEWWTSTSAMNFYTTSNTTLAKTQTSGLYRGTRGTTSAKSTVSAGNGYFYISSDTYPKLLDLMGKQVSLYCWCLPEVANDAAIVIYTVQADGTAQTLTSSTACPAGEYTLLKLESQSLNDDLVEVQIRFKVITNAKYAYFDNALLYGIHQYEYVLPYGLQSGHVSQCLVQTESYSDPANYDLYPRHWEKQMFRVVRDGSYNYLRLKDLNMNTRTIRLKGYKPLSALSADTDTIEVDGFLLNPIIAQAAIRLYKLVQGPVSGEDKGRYYNEIALWEDEFRRQIGRYTMMRPSDTIFVE